MKRIALCLLLGIASCPALAEPFSLQCYSGQGMQFITFDPLTKRVVMESRRSIPLKGEIFFIDDEKIKFHLLVGDISTQVEWNRRIGMLDPGSEWRQYCESTELRPALQMYDRISPSGFR